MSELVKLVNEWAAFESEHPGAQIEDFCRHFLIHKREQEQEGTLFGGHNPPDLNSSIAKMFGRLSTITLYYFKQLMKDNKNIEMEIFGLLNTLYQRKEAKKVDVINDNLMEQSTGIDMLNRLKKNGLITERVDPGDKRAKLIKLTEEGMQTLYKCWFALGEISFMLYHDINEDDKKLVLQLFSNTEIKHTQLALENRHVGMEEIMEKFIGPGKLEEYRERMKIVRQKHQSGGMPPFTINTPQQ